MCLLQHFQLLRDVGAVVIVRTVGTVVTIDCRVAWLLLSAMKKWGKKVAGLGQPLSNHLPCQSREQCESQKPSVIALPEAPSPAARGQRELKTRPKTWLFGLRGYRDPNPLALREGRNSESGAPGCGVSTFAWGWGSCKDGRFGPSWQVQGTVRQKCWWRLSKAHRRNDGTHWRLNHTGATA